MKKHFNRLGMRSATALAAMVLAAQAAWALEPFKVQDIRVEGLQRVEAGTVFASMPLRVGDDYNDEKGAAAIRSLFALGLFKDIRLEANGNVLVVVVEERPTIAEVNFAGTKEFDKDTLTNFYWADYLGDNYARMVVASARKYYKDNGGEGELTLFVSESNLEKNGTEKLDRLVRMIAKWEADISCRTGIYRRSRS